MPDLLRIAFAVDLNGSPEDDRQGFTILRHRTLCGSARGEFGNDRTIRPRVAVAAFGEIDRRVAQRRQRCRLALEFLGTGQRKPLTSPLARPVSAQRPSKGRISSIGNPRSRALAMNRRR